MSARRVYPDQAELCRLFSYDPKTGHLTRKIETSTNARSGARAGTISSKNGCLQVGKDKYLGHRLIWIMVYGFNPVEEIDHINRIPADNRLANLRLATPSQNQFNTGAYRNNTTGAKGVCRGQGGGYTASISAHGRRHHLGSFRTLAEAAAAYQSAAQKHHGTFANCEGPR